MTTIFTTEAIDRNIWECGICQSVNDGHDYDCMTCGTYRHQAEYESFTRDFAETEAFLAEMAVTRQMLTMNADTTFETPEWELAR